MIDILHTDTYRAASNKSTIRVERYVDTGFGAWVLWRIILKRDGEQLGRIIEDQRVTPPSRRTIIRILQKY